GDLRVAGRVVGRVVDGPVSIRAENGHRDRGGVVWRARGGRDVATAGKAGGFFTRVHGRSAVDTAGDYVCGAPGGAVVGLLVSGGGAGRRRLYRAADFQRAG